MVSVLFVCLANICRSPALEAALRHLVVQKGIADRFHIDSCGMGWYHLGEGPDPRTFESAKKRGILIDHKAQQFQESFFKDFDYIFAVDSEIVKQLQHMARAEEEKKKVQLATAYSARFKNQPIPDPYYMTHHGFVDVMEIAIDCSEGILRHIEGK